MNAHLNDQQLVESLLGTNDAAIAAHMENCDRCRAESDGLRLAISAFRESVQEAAEQDDTFWARQRSAIRQRLTDHRLAPSLRWAATAAIVLVVFATLLVTRTPHSAQQLNNDASDDVLLQQVQSDIVRDYPVALAPAVLIDEERNSALSASAGHSFNH